MHFFGRSTQEVSSVLFPQGSNSGSLWVGWAALREAAQQQHHLVRAIEPAPGGRGHVASPALLPLFTFMFAFCSVPFVFSTNQATNNIVFVGVLIPAKVGTVRRVLGCGVEPLALLPRRDLKVSSGSCRKKGSDLEKGKGRRSWKHVSPTLNFEKYGHTLATLPWPLGVPLQC